MAHLLTPLSASSCIMYLFLMCSSWFACLSLLIFCFMVSFKFCACLRRFRAFTRLLLLIRSTCSLLSWGESSVCSDAAPFFEKCVGSFLSEQASSCSFSCCSSSCRRLCLLLLPAWSFLVVVVVGLVPVPLLLLLLLVSARTGAGWRMQARPSLSWSFFFCVCLQSGWCELVSVMILVLWET